MDSSHHIKKSLFFLNWCHCQVLSIHIKNTSKDINPYAPSDAPWHKKRAVNSGKDNSDDALGKVLINSENSDTQIFCSLCFDKPCSDSNNRMSNTIDVN